jgi:hypothetical protein
VESLGEETMEAIYKIAREVGPVGALALLVLAGVAAAGTEGNLKEWYELGFKVTIVNDPRRVAVVVAIVLFLVQAAASSRFTEREDKRHDAELTLQRESSEFSVQKVQSERDAAVAEVTAMRMRLSGDQAVIAKRDAEWHKLESSLKDIVRLQMMMTRDSYRELCNPPIVFARSSVTFSSLVTSNLQLVRLYEIFDGSLIVLSGQ